MGVQGLWQLLDGTGKPIPLESLQGQILAIDVSIWLHQANHGITSRNGHLQLLFSRVCKLLFHGIRPVFVFDGPTPAIKRDCMEKRRRNRARALANCADLRNAVLTNYLKTHALSSATLSKELLPKNKRLPLALTNVTPFDEIFHLSAKTLDDTEIRDADESSDDVLDGDYDQLDNIDIESTEFKTLPLEVQHEILMDMRDLKKRKCLLKPIAMPETAKDFSTFQLQNFLDRSSVTQKIEDVRRDMNRDGLGILGLANVDGAILRKIASEDSSYMVYVQNLPKNSRARLSGMKESVQLDNSPEELPATNTEHCSSENQSTSESQSKSRDLSALNAYQTIACSTTESLGERIEQNHWDQLKKIPPSIDSNIPAVDEIKTSDTKIVNKKEMVSEYFEAPQKLTSDGADKEKQPEVNKQVEANLCDSGISSQSQQSINICATDSSSEDEFEDVPIIEPSKPPILEDEKLKESVSPKQEFLNLEVQDKQTSLGDTVQNAKERSELYPLIESTTEELTTNNSTEHWVPSDSVESLEVEEMRLVRELEKEEAKATTMTELMYEQCQKLLKLFGLPFIVSPGEAEAQCAFLDSVGLVNGSVTDDSDVWLFGGKTVYKNFFEREKFVEKYTMAEIEAKLMINRSNLVCLAMMLGSDYCEGIENIGPVHGMEVLEEFGRQFGIVPLEKFKKWHKSISNEIVPQVTNTVRRRLMKFELPEHFPSQRVFDAYYQAKVDESREKFKWGNPDVFGLKQFMSEYLGWPTKKLDEMLDPVIEKQKKLVMQMSLDQFYSVRLGTAKRVVKSKRINEAISKMKGQKSEPVNAQSEPTPSTTLNITTSGRSKRVAASTRSSRSCKMSNCVDGTEASDEGITSSKKPRRIKSQKQSAAKIRIKQSEGERRVQLSESSEENDD